MTDMTDMADMGEPVAATTMPGAAGAPVVSSSRSDIVPAEIIQSFVAKVEPGDHVSLTLVLGSFAFCLLVIFATTAWWMLK